MENIINFCYISRCWRLHKGKKLQHKINIKSTNTFQYLHYTSCHPQYVKKSIPKSLAIRASKLCSEPKYFDEYVLRIKEAFIDRGYPKKLVEQKLNLNNQYQHATVFDSSIPKLITQFYPGLHKLNNIMKIGFNILHSSPLTSTFLTSAPRVVFTKPPTLKDLLSKPKFPVSDEERRCGVFPCTKPRCLVCNRIWQPDTLHSNNASKEYKTR